MSILKKRIDEFKAMRRAYQAGKGDNPTITHVEITKLLIADEFLRSIGIDPKCGSPKR